MAIRHIILTWTESLQPSLGQNDYGYVAFTNYESENGWIREVSRSGTSNHRSVDRSLKADACLVLGRSRRCLSG